MRRTVDRWKMWFAGDGPVQYTHLSESHGTVDQWKMQFAGMDLSSTCLSESHGKGDC